MNYVVMFDDESQPQVCAVKSFKKKEKADAYCQKLREELKQEYSFLSQEEVDSTYWVDECS